MGCWRGCHHQADLSTCFSLVLAAILVLAAHAGDCRVVKQAEQHEAGVMLTLLMAERRPR